MGRRTHQKKIPPDAVMFKGKPWTPLMIMEYCGITRYKYNQAVEGKSPERLLEWGVRAIAPTARSITEDTSRLITLSTTLTLKQWYYLAVKDGLETPVTFSEFQRRVGHYRYRHGFGNDDGGDSEALSATLRSMGKEYLSTWTRETLDTLPTVRDRLQSREYLCVINAYHAEIKKSRREDVTQEMPNANEQWFKCLLADTRLHWLFVEEYERKMSVKDTHIRRVEQANKELIRKFDEMAIKYKAMEKQLADFRRSATVKGSEETGEKERG